MAGGNSFLEGHLASLSYLLYDLTISLLQVDTGMCPIGFPKKMSLKLLTAVLLVEEGCLGDRC